MERRLSVPATIVLETLELPDRGYDEKSVEDDACPVAGPRPQVNTEGSGSWCDLKSARAWRNQVVWRAGVSILKSEGTLTNYRILHLFPDNRGCGLRVSELLVRFACRNAYDVATPSRTRGDSRRQHDPRITHHLRHSFDDRRAHQLNGDDGRCIFRALPSRSGNNLRLLSTRGRCARWDSPQRSLRKKIGIRDSQR
jgi:hypothetical protein